MFTKITIGDDSMVRTENQMLKKRLLPWVMFGMGALYYCMAYFLRVSPSVMKEQLLSHFKIKATEFGALSAASMMLTHQCNFSWVSSSIDLDRVGCSFQPV